MIRLPPRRRTTSPTLKRPSRAWSASKAKRVCAVAACHIGLTGRRVDGIPTTGMVPALASVTSAFIARPQIIMRTPARAQGDRMERTTSQRIAQHSQSQMRGYWDQANWCAADRKCILTSPQWPDLVKAGASAVPNLWKGQVSRFQSDVRTLPGEEKNFHQGEDQPRSPRGKNERITGEVNRVALGRWRASLRSNIGSDILSGYQLRIRLQMLRLEIGWLRFRGIPMRRTG